MVWDVGDYLVVCLFSSHLACAFQNFLPDRNAGRTKSLGIRRCVMHGVCRLACRKTPTACLLVSNPMWSVLRVYTSRRTGRTRPRLVRGVCCIGGSSLESGSSPGSSCTTH